MTDHDEQQPNDNLNNHASETEASEDVPVEAPTVETEADNEDAPVKQPTVKDEVQETEAPTSVEAHDDLDVEGALAAIADLHILTRDETDLDADEAQAADSEDEDETGVAIQEFERIDHEPVPEEVETDAQALSAPTDNAYQSAFPRPPLSTLHRGQMASVIPALFLIVVGGYLTFIVTTIDMSLQPLAIAGVLVGGVGAMLIAQWLSSARWATGSLFIGVLMLLVGGLSVYLLMPNNLSLSEGYPLLLTAIGTAFVVTDIASPSGHRLWLMGLILALSGLASVAVLTLLPQLNLPLSNPALLVLAVVIVAVFAIAPFIYRRQQ
ncbi:MAG: hypothetical protein ACFE0Q_02015 [Anaerolineae bacterium]